MYEYMHHEFLLQGTAGFNENIQIQKYTNSVKSESEYKRLLSKMSFAKWRQYFLPMCQDLNLQIYHFRPCSAAIYDHVVQ